MLIKSKTMQIEKTKFEGLIILQPKIYTDNRGEFLESWNEAVFKDLGINIIFKQDNQSKSNKNVLRGLHFQHPPNEQGKLVRVSKGSVLDVVVDLRKESATYGQHFKKELSSENSTMLWIPSGFAHGFLTLEDDTIFQYKCDSFYNPKLEDCLLWNDPLLKIDWNTKNPIISSKDLHGKLFKDIVSNI